MQPHSMCALALSYYHWINEKKYSSCTMRVKYNSYKGEKVLYYDLKEIDYSPKQLSVAIVRSGGGLACRVTSKLVTSERVEMTHGTQHVAGLTEIFTIRKKEIIGGYHKNSKRYRTFRSIEIKKDSIGEETKIELECEVESARGNDFYKIRYELSMESRKEKSTS